MQIHKETIESKRGGQHVRAQQTNHNSVYTPVHYNHSWALPLYRLTENTIQKEITKITKYRKKKQSQISGQGNNNSDTTTIQTHHTHTHSHPPACKHPWHKHQLTNHNQINQDKTQAKQPGCHSSGCILPQTKQSQQPFHVQLPAKHRKVSYSQ